MGSSYEDTQAAYDEHYSTGEDPTGGEIEALKEGEEEDFESEDS